MPNKFSYRESSPKPNIEKTNYDYILNIMKCTIADTAIRSILREIACVFYRTDTGDTSVCKEGDYTVSEVPIEDVMRSLVESGGKDIKEIYAEYHTHPYPMTIKSLREDAIRAISNLMFRDEAHFVAYSLVYAYPEIIPYFSVQDIYAGTKFFIDVVYKHAYYYSTKIGLGVIALATYDEMKDQVIVRMASPKDVIDKLGNGDYNEAMAKLEELKKEEDKLTVELNQKLDVLYGMLLEAKKQGNKKEMEHLADLTLDTVKETVSRPGKSLYSLRLYLDVLISPKIYTLDYGKLKAECKSTWL